MCGPLTKKKPKSSTMPLSVPYILNGRYIWIVLDSSFLVISVMFIIPVGKKKKKKKCLPNTTHRSTITHAWKLSLRSAPHLRVRMGDEATPVVIAAATVLLQHKIGRTMLLTALWPKVQEEAGIDNCTAAKLAAGGVAKCFEQYPAVFLVRKPGPGGAGPVHVSLVNEASCEWQVVPAPKNKLGGDARFIEEAAADSRYKTILCRIWAEPGGCRMGARCLFAHGEEELRNCRNRHPSKPLQAAHVPKEVHLDPEVMGFLYSLHLLFGEESWPCTSRQLKALTLNPGPNPNPNPNPKPNPNPNQAAQSALRTFMP